MTTPGDLTEQDHFTSPVNLTAEHIAAARTVLSELSSEHSIRLALVSGSLAFGLGHGSSDIDLYVMAHDESKLVGGIYNQDGYEVQINVLTTNGLRVATEWARGSGSNRSTDRRAERVDIRVRKLAARLMRGELLHADDDIREELSRIDRDSMRRQWLSVESLTVCRLMEDANGALAANDLDTAFLATRVAVEHACEAALAACDDMYIGSKFLMRRLSRTTQLRPLVAAARSALDMPSDDAFLTRRSNDARTYAEEVVMRAGLASHVLSASMLLGWERPVTEGFPPYHSYVEGPSRDPFHTINRFSDGIGLAGPDRGFKLSESAAWLWFNLDGQRTWDEIETNMSPSEVRGVKKFIEIGAARYRSTTAKVCRHT